MLSAQRIELDRFENELAERLQNLGDLVARELASGQSIHVNGSCEPGEGSPLLRSDLDDLRRLLTARLAEMAEAGSGFEDARLAAGRFQQELGVCQALLKEAQAQQEQRRIEFTALIEQLSTAQTQVADSHAQLADTQSQLAAARDRQIELERQAAMLGERLAADDRARESDVPSAELEAEAAGLRRGRDGLAKKLSDAELKLSAASSRPADSPKSDELQRRFEMAVDELRVMKLANLELEKKLAKQRETGSAPATPGTGLDWESQKQRLLAALEADDRQDAQSVEERHTIEGTIQITDQIIAAKDQEITELRRLAAEPFVRAPVTEATLAAEVLDRDEMIRRGRESLVAAQSEWHEKAAAAEIEISMERATIARQRAELEEKLRLIQQQQQSPMRSAESHVSNATKPTRTSWRTWLGMRDNQQ